MWCNGRLPVEPGLYIKEGYNINLIKEEEEECLLDLRSLW